MRPSSAETRSARPRRPDPRSGSAPPMPSSATSTTAWPLRARHAHGGLARVRVLGDVGERLGDHEVGRRLDRLGQPLARASRRGRPRSARARRAPRARRRARGRRARRGGCRAPARAARRAPASAPPGRRRAARSARSGSLCTLPWARRMVSESATSRCWAPSCRLRSSRRRSAVPASTIRAREARSSSTRARSCACRRSFSIARPAAAATERSSSGSSHSVRSCTIAPTRRPSSSTRRHGARRVVLGGQLDHVAVGVDPAALVVEPEDELQRAVAERVGEPAAQRRRCPAPRRAAAAARRPRPRAPRGCARGRSGTPTAPRRRRAGRAQPSTSVMREMPAASLPERGGEQRPASRRPTTAPAPSRAAAAASRRASGAPG